MLPLTPQRTTDEGDGGVGGEKDERQAKRDALPRPANPERKALFHQSESAASGPVSVKTRPFDVGKESPEGRMPILPERHEVGSAIAHSNLKVRPLGCKHRVEHRPYKGRGPCYPRPHSRQRQHHDDGFADHGAFPDGWFTDSRW